MGALAYGVLFLLTVVGTHARTGLLYSGACVMYAVFSRKPIRRTLVVLTIGLIGLSFVKDD